MEESAENTQIEILKSSGLLAEFVRNSGGTWNQAEVEGLLIRIRELNVTIPLEKIGTLLEAEKVAFMQKIAENKTGVEETVNFGELSLGKKREFLGAEIKRKMKVRS